MSHNCQYCSEPITSKWGKKFCSSSCNAKANNPKRRKNIIVCPICGGTKLASHNKQIYCSKVCMGVSSRKKNSSEYTSPRTLRAHLLRTRVNQCETCHNHIWNSLPIPLTVNHIDGNSNNNNEDNLQLLCWNCHAQTPTFGIRNKGNGRFFRRVRYSQGKSS